MKHLLLLIFFAAAILSCSDQADIKPVVERNKLESRDGDDTKDRCVALIFPVELELGDGGTIDIADQAEWNTFWTEWKESMGDSDVKPHLIYPTEVAFKDRVILVESADHMKALKAKCKGDEGTSDKRPCFKLVYPVTLELPDGSNVDVHSAEEWHDVAIQWSLDHPDSASKPTLSYPVDVTKGDRLLTIADESEMIALKKRCASDSDVSDRIKCYILLYPVTLILPDGTLQEVASPKEWHELARIWASENPDSDQRPALQ